MPKKSVSSTALSVLKKRYFLRNSRGRIVENTKKMFQRVAGEISKIDRKYSKKTDVNRTKKDFFRMISALDFLPNSPTLMNAGTELGQLSACFVVPVEDSMQSIFEALKTMAMIHQSGGGTGFSFSKIRPKGSIISTSKGTASGPVSFISIFDKATDVIKQGGKRRGANIGILNVDHPDIIDFIRAKKNRSLENFNLSVGITDKFMDAVKKNKNFALINPNTKKTDRKVKARKIFDELVRNAWQGGDPGILFLDEINRKNKLKLGRIEATNPCGEQPLYPYESCNLGSINLSNMVKKDNEGNNYIDWEKLRKTVSLAVHFLDNVIDANRFPLPEIEKATKASRKIGLGVMGFADMLIKLGVLYDSDIAVRTAEKIMKFINQEARKKSEELGRKRGSFPYFRKSRLAGKYRHMRNATVTTIAPTGTLSIIAGVSSGIEPVFAVKFRRKIMGGRTFTEYHPLYTKADHKLFVTATNVKLEQHVRIQAAFQKHTDNAVSKTVNLPDKATLNDVRKIFMLAYDLKCKGVTVYRYGSKKGQVLKLCETC